MRSRITGLYRLSIAERRELIGDREIPESLWAELDNGGLDLETADGMIENVVATYALPFAIAANFTIGMAALLLSIAGMLLLTLSFR